MADYYLIKDASVVYNRYPWIRNKFNNMMRGK